MDQLWNVVRPGLRRLLFVVLVASTAVVASERMFWFWATGLDDHLFVTIAYTLPAAVALWAVARYRVGSWWSLLLATPLFAIVTEGVLTPITYTGGPFVPVFPAWFALWHGMLAFGVLVIGVRQLLLARRWRLLALVATGLGVFWGVWSTTLWLPENLDDPELVEVRGALVILDPAAFARYAATFTAIAALGHWLLGRVWPSSFEPGRFGRYLAGGVVVVMVTVWTLSVPWALPMFAAYVALQRWGLRRHRSTADGPDLFAQLAGRTPVAGLVALAPMAIAAAGTYWLLWSVDPAEHVLRAVMRSTFWTQTVAGFVVSAVALWRAGRTATTERAAPPSPGGDRAEGLATVPVDAGSAVLRGSAGEVVRPRRG